MPVTIETNSVIAGHETIPYISFPGLYESFLRVNPNTRQLEQTGAQLIENDCQSFEQLEQFIRDVCKWGNHPGIGGRIINQNTEESITRYFRETINAFNGDLPASSALIAINKIKQLGSTSFASKHLRFLCPDLCPVLDSWLSDDLQYSLNPRGYQHFADDCSTIADNLNTLRILHAENVNWRAADVEASIYQYLYPNH